LDLLADAMVKLTEHDSLSRETVRRRLAEGELKPWRLAAWLRPAKSISMRKLSLQCGAYKNALTKYPPFTRSLHSGMPPECEYIYVPINTRSSTPVGRMPLHVTFLELLLEVVSTEREFAGDRSVLVTFSTTGAL
jgi:hypothetical protein